MDPAHGVKCSPYTGPATNVQHFLLALVPVRLGFQMLIDRSHVVLVHLSRSKGEMLNVESGGLPLI
jgi:hypothetical protein